MKSLNDEALFKEFSKDVIERFQNCVNLFKVRKDRLGKKQDNANGCVSNSNLDIELTAFCRLVVVVILQRLIVPW